MCTQEKLKMVTDEVVQGVLSASNDVSRIIMYGSQARDDSVTDSDIDILVLVSVPEEKLYDLKKILWKITNKISLEHDEVVSLLVSTEDEYLTMANELFYRNVEKDGIELYRRAN